jgi:hypothetical protein
MSLTKTEMDVISNKLYENSLKAAARFGFRQDIATGAISNLSPLFGVIYVTVRDSDPDFVRPLLISDLLEVNEGAVDLDIPIPKFGRITGPSRIKMNLPSDSSNIMHAGRSRLSKLVRDVAWLADYANSAFDK